MKSTRHGHAQEDAIEGFDEAELPGFGPGGIAGSQNDDRKLAPPPPRLCEAGPCVHYHRFEIQLDAEGPKAGAVEVGGKLVGDAGKQPFYVRVHHYCYPDVGIETELGSLPVLKCNRWSPITPHAKKTQDQVRAEFWQSEEGLAFAAERHEWERARAEERAAEDELDDVQTWILMFVRDNSRLALCDLSRPADKQIIEIFDCDAARTAVSRAYLQSTWGRGSYLLRVINRDDDAVQTEQPVEVT